MGRFEGRTPHEASADPEARQRADGGGLERLVPRQVGQQGWQAPGEHGLPRPGRPDHRHVVPAGSGRHQGVHRLVVAGDVGEVRFGRRGVLERGTLHGIQLHGIELGTVRDGGGAQPRHRDDVDAVHEFRLRRVRCRNQNAPNPRVACREHRRQHAGHRAQAPVEPQLPQVDGSRGRLGGHVARGRQCGDRDREVESAALLPQRRRRQVDRELALGERTPRVDRGSADPFARLPESGIRETDEDERREPGGDVGLDLDDVAADSGQRHGERPCERHHATPRRCSIDGSLLHASITATASIRIGPETGPCARHHSATSRRRRARLAAVIASNGCP